LDYHRQFHHGLQPHNIKAAITQTPTFNVLTMHPALIAVAADFHVLRREAPYSDTAADGTTG
jgi:hypothetical protein